MKRFGALVAALLLAALGFEPARGGDKEQGTDKKVEKKGEDKKGEKKGEDKKGDGEKGKAEDSPEKVFKDFTAALHKADGKAICACLTKEAATQFAGKLAATAVMVRTALGAGKKGKSDKEGADKTQKGAFGADGSTPKGELVKALGAVLDKYGKEKDTFAKYDTETMMKLVVGQDPARVHARMAAELKQPCAFIGDALRVFRKFAGKFGSRQMNYRIEGDLKDLQVDGVEAKATVAFTKVGKDKGRPIAFTKDNTGWKISRLPEFGLTFGSQPPRPAPGGLEIRPRPAVQPGPPRR